MNKLVVLTQIRIAADTNLLSYIFEQLLLALRNNNEIMQAFEPLHQMITTTLG